MALAIGGKTIKQLQSEMTQAEYLSWVEYYKRHPFDDFTRYHKTAAAIAGSNGAKVDKVLEWLNPPHFEGEFNEVDISIFKAFGLRGN